MAYLLEELEYANSIGDKSLRKCLDRLVYWETGKCEDQPDGWPWGHHYYNCKVHLHKDNYDKHSFYFVWCDKDGNRIMNGGIIFHGNPGEADNSHSVTLERTYGWTIHT